MNKYQINTTDDVYQFVKRLKDQCSTNSKNELFAQLDDAMRVGSSGLEIMGALQQVIVSNIALIQELLGPEGENEARLIIKFIDKAFGR